MNMPGESVAILLLCSKIESAIDVIDLFTENPYRETVRDGSDKIEFVQGVINGSINGVKKSIYLYGTVWDAWTTLHHSFLNQIVPHAWQNTIGIVYLNDFRKNLKTIQPQSSSPTSFAESLSKSIGLFSEAFPLCKTQRKTIWICNLGYDYHEEPGEELECVQKGVTFESMNISDLYGSGIYDFQKIFKEFLSSPYEFPEEKSHLSSNYPSITEEEDHKLLIEPEYPPISNNKPKSQFKCCSRD